MHLQLSALLSISILALSGMVQAQFGGFPFPGAGGQISLSSGSGNVRRQSFGDCLQAKDSTGSTVTSASFTQPTLCNLFNSDDCTGPSIPIPFPPFIPIPNPFVAGTVVNSAKCSSV